METEFNPTASLHSIEFYIPSLQDIQSLAVCEITKTSLNSKGIPVPGGVMDLRMGSTESRFRCSTCRNSMDICSGHFGYIKLATYLYHTGYMPYVLKTLRSLCVYCSWLLIDPTDPRINCGKHGIDLLTYISTLCKKKVCRNPECKGKQPEYHRCGWMILTKWSPVDLAAMSCEEERDWAQTPFTAEQAYRILQFAKDEDITVLGFHPTRSHPANMILSALLVPPPMTRPSGGAGGSSGGPEDSKSSRKQDDITKMLQEIIKANQMAKEVLRNPLKTRIEKHSIVEVLQAKLAFYIKPIPAGKKAATQLTESVRETSSVLIRRDIQDRIRRIKEGREGGPSTPSFTPAQELEVSRLAAMEAMKFNRIFTEKDRGSSRSTQDLMNLNKRLSGKNGRIRGNMSGKRVDYSGRSVISPEPLYDINELGVPQEVAMKLTIRNFISTLSLPDVIRRIRIGASSLQGCKEITLPDGGFRHATTLADLAHKPKVTIDLALCSTAMKEAIIVELTDASQRNLLGTNHCTYERPLQDGDYVIFNRQPSLHKMSMMCHKVRVLPFGLSFRLPLCDVKAYNADFDGDEMNIHVITSIDARTEMQYLMGVPFQIISPQSNKPIIGMVMDSVSGSFRLTEQGRFYTYPEVCQMILQLKYYRGWSKTSYLPPPTIWKPQPLWTGKQMYSLLFPRSFYYDKVLREPVEYHATDSVGYSTKQCAVLDPDEPHVMIREGILWTGKLCSKAVGLSNGGLIHLMYRDHGPDVTKEFLSDAQRLLMYVMQHVGLTVGIDDCIVDPTAQEEIKTDIAVRMEHVRAVHEWCITLDQSQRIHQDMVLRQTARDPRVERLVSACLQGSRPYVGALALTSMEEKQGYSNGLVTMVRSGAKGTNLNISQITGSVGQQCVSGQRIHSESGHGRTLSCYSHGSCFGVEEGGFVRRSYVQGLSPQEFFFHAMGGREGLVDTAVKTAESGYLQRELVKATENQSVLYDGTVRSSLSLHQCLYGGDGMDATHIERIRLSVLTWSNEKCMQEATGAGETWETSKAAREEAAEVMRLRDHLRVTRIMFANNGTMLEAGFIPIHIPRMIQKVVLSVPRTTSHSAEEPFVTVKYLRQQRRQIIQTLYDCIPSFAKRIQGFFDWVLKVHIWTELSARYATHHLTKQQIDHVVRDCQQHIRAAIVQPGEAVGPLAVTSIGEPTTQMTLNVFHFSGIASKNVTLGVPRLMELIDATKEIRTPSATIHVAAPYKQSEHAIERLARSLEVRTIADCIRQANVYFDPDLRRTVRTEDQPLIDRWLRFQTPEEVAADQMDVSPHVIRYELDRDMLHTMHIYPSDLVRSIREQVGLKVWMLATEDVATTSPTTTTPSILLLRCRGLNYTWMESSTTTTTQPTTPTNILSNDSTGTKGGMDVATAGMLLLREAHASYLSSCIVSGISTCSSMIRRLWRTRQTVATMLGRRGYSLVVSSPLYSSFSPSIPSTAAYPSIFPETEDMVVRLWTEGYGERCSYWNPELKTLLSTMEIEKMILSTDPKQNPFGTTGSVANNERTMLSVFNSLLLRAVRPLPSRRRRRHRSTEGGKENHDPGYKPRDRSRHRHTSKSPSPSRNGRGSRSHSPEEKDRHHRPHPHPHHRPHHRPHHHHHHHPRSSRQEELFVFFNRGPPPPTSEHTTGIQAIRLCAMILAMYAKQRRIKPKYIRGIIVSPSGATAPALKQLKGVSQSTKIWMEVIPEHRLQFDLCAHEYVPLHTKISKEEEDLLRQELRTKELKQVLPQLQPWDPVASYLGFQPGDVIRIDTPDATVGYERRYRIIPHPSKGDRYKKPLASVYTRGKSGSTTNIQRCIVTSTKEISIHPTNGTLLYTPEWMIETEGCDVLTICSLQDSGVNPYRTYSNDIQEMMECFGIEAARIALIQEMTKVLSFDNNFIDPRHIKILVDTMTFIGIPTGCTRHGITKQFGPLARASFEESIEELQTASAFAESNVMTSDVTSQILFGQPVTIGTGCLGVLTDWNRQHTFGTPQASLVPTIHPVDSVSSFPPHTQPPPDTVVTATPLVIGSTFGVTYKVATLIDQVSPLSSPLLFSSVPSSSSSSPLDPTSPISSLPTLLSPSSLSSPPKDMFTKRGKVRKAYKWMHQAYQLPPLPELQDDNMDEEHTDSKEGWEEEHRKSTRTSPSKKKVTFLRSKESPTSKKKNVFQQEVSSFQLPTLPRLIAQDEEDNVSSV